MRTGLDGVDTIPHHRVDWNGGLGEQAREVGDRDGSAVGHRNVGEESGDGIARGDISNVSLAQDERSRDASALQPAAVELEGDKIVDNVNEAADPGNGNGLARLVVLAPDLSVGAEIICG